MPSPLLVNTVFFLLATAATTIFFQISFIRSISSSFFIKHGAIPTVPSPAFNSTLLEFASLEKLESNHNMQVGLNRKAHPHHPWLLRRATHQFLNRKLIPWRISKALPLKTWSPTHDKAIIDLPKLVDSWHNSQRFDPNVILEIPSILNSAINVSKGRHLSCAVVGNSGILLKKKLGDLIDGHDVVIRLNNARIKGFQKNVGSKTNISFINSNILHGCLARDASKCNCNPYGKGVALVFYICQAIHILDYSVCRGLGTKMMSATDPRFDVLCGRIVKYYSAKGFVEKTGKGVEEWGDAHGGSQFHYSSGFQAVIMGVGLCERVSIFGFGKSEFAKHHYHTEQKMELRLHDYEAEYKVYHDLVNNPYSIPFIPREFRFPIVTVYQ